MSPQFVIGLRPRGTWASGKSAAQPGIAVLLYKLETTHVELVLMSRQEDLFFSCAWRNYYYIPPSRNAPSSGMEVQ